MISWCILYMYARCTYMRVFVSSFIMQSHAINGYFSNKVINTVFSFFFLLRRRRARNFIILHYLFFVRINERDCVRSGAGGRGINIVIIRRIQSGCSANAKAAVSAWQRHISSGHGEQAVQRIVISTGGRRGGRVRRGRARCAAAAEGRARGGIHDD